ncbi:MAG: hypothetical protein HXS46_09180 [Theionarchaea archaeon]|nr:hypothetical protein [Theionarchaea archaeon]
MLENLDIGGTRIKLKRPFRLEYTYHNGFYEANNDEIRVSAVSESFDGVIEIIGEKIEILYDLYVNDDSMELTEDALELRKKLKEYLGNSLCLRYVKPKPITIFLFVVIFLNVYLALTDSVMREYSIEFIVLLAPLPAVVYLIRGIFGMMLERAEELSRK